MSEHGHHHEPIMSDATKQRLHAMLSNFDHVHHEKEEKLRENQKKLADFIARLPHFATEFTKDMAKHDFCVTTGVNSMYPERHQLIVQKDNQPFASLDLSGQANSDRVVINVFEGLSRQPLQPFENVNELLSQALIKTIEAAMKEKNKI